MAVTRSRATDRAVHREKHTGERQWWGPQLALIGAVILLVGLGLLRIYTVKARQLEPELVHRPTLLTEVDQAEDLLPALAEVFPEMPDRRFAARWLWDYLSKHDGPRGISHVGSLARARVPIGQIKGNGELVEYRRALEQALAEASFGTQAAGTQAAGTQATGTPTAGTPAASTPLESIRVLSPRQLQQLKSATVVRTLEAFRGRLALAWLIFAAGISIPLVFWRFRYMRPDPWLLPIAGALSGLGLILMVSLRDPLRDTLLFQDFAVGVLGGGILLGLTSLIDFHGGGLRRLSFVPLLAALLLSLVLVVFGSGPAGSDARVNLVLGPITLQPVEAVKLLVVLFLAGYFARRWDLLRTYWLRSERMPNFFRWLDLPRWEHLLPVVVGMVLSLIFLFVQRDLGPALVLAWTFLALYSVARGRAGLALLGVSVLVIGCWAGYQLGFPRTVYTRIAMWLNPWENLLRGGDQLAMGLWAVAAGSIRGVGLGWGETVRVPAAHTDFILAAVAEELGFLGLAVLLGLYGALLWRGLSIARRSEGDYTFFLGLGLTCLLAAQLFLIAAGVLGLLPLSGVTTPLLSYGKSSQWMTFIALGVLAGLSVHRSAGPSPVDAAETPEGRFGEPARRLALVGSMLLAAVLARAGWIQLFHADEVMIRPLLALQAGDEVGFIPNPRLREIADQIPRGTIFDRNGIPIATTDRAVLEAHRSELQALGIDVAVACPDPRRRCYPLGPAGFHLLGDIRERVRWAASNKSYAEKEHNTRLQGFDDHATFVDITRPDGKVFEDEMRLDYRELLPYWWNRRDPDNLKPLLDRDRRLFLTVDARLQARLTKMLGEALKSAGLERGAAVVLDPATGALLAAATWPVPKEIGGALRRLPEDAPELFDRPRFGIYPPGSTFKVVTAIAALRRDPRLINATYECVRLEDGRVGNRVKGERRPIRDDIMDHEPHGEVDMARGIQVSCNAYFAQLAVDAVKAPALLETAKLFGISAARPETVAELGKSLPFAGYGQGEVQATPLELATVAASIAAKGTLRKPTLLFDDTTTPSKGTEVLPAASADRIARSMRLVVTGGTGRVVSDASLPIAGKTGTAEVEGRPSHGWFIGYAPWLEGPQPGPPARQIAFAVLAENGRYGARVAAPLAAEIVKTAQELGLIP